MNFEKEYHINLSEEDGAKYAIICGAPERVPLIASFFEDSEFLTQNREFLSYCGYLDGERVLVTSTGIGGPSASITVEELNHIGVDTIIRIGTCGGIQPDITPGEVLIATGAVRMDGTTKEYAPIEFPAIADFEVTSALVNACNNLNVKYKAGVVQSKDSFYGQHSPASTAVSETLLNKWEAWKRCGVLGSEMECSTLYVISSIRKIRAGAVLYVLWNQERENVNIDDENKKYTTSAIEVAVQALKNIIYDDGKRK